MALTRSALEIFTLANKLYAGAQVSVYAVDEDTGLKTATLATLYSAATGSTELLNPQSLDSKGRFKQPVYVDAPVIATVESVNFASHDTGILAGFLGVVLADAEAAAQQARTFSQVAERAASRAALAANSLNFTAYFASLGTQADDAADFLTLLGVSAYVQTIFDDADAAAARTTLDVPSNAEAILDTIVDAKGDLIAGTAADTPARLAVGTDGQGLLADSSTSTGMKWGSVNISVPVRQTVLGGPVDSSGYPNFLPSTDADLNLASQNITSSAPFVVAAANGFGISGAVNRVGQSTANLTWTGLTANRAAATPNFLYVDVNADGTLTTGSTTVAPAYQFGGTYSTTANQFTFNRQEMVGKVGNGSAATQTYRVFVGEAATDGTGVISTVCYAYQGKYRSAEFGVAVSTAYTQNHNIGTLPTKHNLLLVCKTADQNWIAGQECDFSYSDNNGAGAIAIARDTKVAYVTVGINFYIANRTTGTMALATYANWKFVIECERGW